MDDDQKAANYALNGKIMLCSVTILFFVVFVVVCFHGYARLCCHRQHPHRRRHRRRRRVFSQNIIPPAIGIFSSNVSHKGLDISILKTLPSFVYDTSTHDALLDCPVCLSEFEDGERGRVLPNCKHAFHIECIDTWFKSNSNCPLCRCHARPDVPTETQHEVVITVSEEPGGSGSDHDEGEDKMGSPSVRFFTVEECGRRPLDLAGMAMDERVRNFGWPKSHGVKGSGDQVASLKRIWSI